MDTCTDKGRGSFDTEAMKTFFGVVLGFLGLALALIFVAAIIIRFTGGLDLLGPGLEKWQKDK